MTTTFDTSRFVCRCLLLQAGLARNVRLIHA